jgi:HK97 family phage major capsid protein
VATFTADELIDLQHSVDPAYRNERSQFMLSDTALAIARKLKDSQNRYLFQPGGVAARQRGPDTIAGSPYVINNDMAVPATGVKSVLYGDFQAGYVIRIVQDIQVITFTERYLDFLQVGHSSFMRADGKTQNTSAYKALTQA